MAKKSAIEKNNKRRALAQAYKDQRKELRAIIRDADATLQERMSAAKKMQKLKRDTSAIRVVNRCEISGRPKGVLRLFSINRIELRHMIQNGYIPGVLKS